MSTFYFTMIGAAVAAACAIWSAASAHRLQSAIRRTKELAVQMGDLQRLYDLLFESHKKLRSGESMAARRDQKGVQTANSRSYFDRRPGDSKADARRALALPDNPLEFTKEAIRRAGSKSNNGSDE